MTTKHRITINLDDKEYNKLTDISKKLDVSLAWLGRRAFSDLLSKYDSESEVESSVIVAMKKSASRP